MKKPKSAVLLMTFLAAVIIVLGLWLRTDHKPGQITSKKPPVKEKIAPKVTYPLDKASSLWVIVNKGRVLPSGYVPQPLVVPNIPLRLSASNPEMMLRSDTASAIEAMVSAAKQDQINLMLASGYRSYALQVAVHDSEVRANGQAKADSVSARPGHSEHQTGLAADLEPTNRTCEVKLCFADSLEGRWLAAKAYKYGFIIRYQKDKTAETGYNYEPWHVRFVGHDLAATIYSQNISLERYFGLSFYADYPANSLQLN